MRAQKVRVQKEMLRIDVLHCYCLSFPLRGNNVSVIINLSYCHVSKTVKSRTARKKIRGGHCALSVAEYEVAVEIVERVMQPACTKRIHPRLHTRGSRERP